jgi:hypothetical protein
MIFTCISCVCGFSMGQSLGIIPKYSATYDAETRVYRETREADQTHEAATAAVLALTPSATPTPTDTPTRTLTPTNTLTPTDTLTPTNTNTPRVSPTSTATQTLPSTTRPTQTPANTSRPAATAVQVTPRSAQTYYAISNANLRPCPRTVASCAPEVALAPGDEITVTGTIQGEAVSGNTTWYQVEYRNQTLYAHSSVLSPNRPVAPAAPAAPANSGNDSGGNTVQSTVPPAAPGWNCNGDVYNCGDFSTCAEAMSYLSACPDDQSRLDANNDDVPCESLCK